MCILVCPRPGLLPSLSQPRARVGAHTRRSTCCLLLRPPHVPDAAAPCRFDWFVPNRITGVATTVAKQTKKEKDVQGSPSLVHPPWPASAPRLGAATRGRGRMGRRGAKHRQSCSLLKGAPAWGAPALRGDGKAQDSRPRDKKGRGPSRPSLVQGAGAAAGRCAEEGRKGDQGGRGRVRWPRGWRREGGGFAGGRYAGQLGTQR